MYQLATFNATFYAKNIQLLILIQNCHMIHSWLDMNITLPCMSYGIRKLPQQCDEPILLKSF